jgi:hypothetical protein
MLPLPVAPVREIYKTSVLSSGNRLKKRIIEGAITTEKAMKEAVELSNIHLDKMRERNSPLGLLMKRLINLFARSMKFYQKKYARKTFHVNYKDVEDPIKKNRVCFKVQTFFLGFFFFH